MWENLVTLGIWNGNDLLYHLGQMSWEGSSPLVTHLANPLNSFDPNKGCFYKRTLDLWQHFLENTRTKPN